LFITGRRKDIIIKAGRNLYPQELEEAVGDVPGIRKGCVAAFGVSDPEIGTERLVVVAETRELTAGDRARLREAVVDRVCVHTKRRHHRMVRWPVGSRSFAVQFRAQPEVGRPRRRPRGVHTLKSVKSPIYA
jgi:acyl-CoA synthetase (AMP-forming)/AMP-acid ligase II